ncbi:MAG TPA: BatA domain-containing protein, partial [Candidatus Eisenbacteria bacterium]|nr:BatA domain-containing protein [Candidatus Eisenbacteria bacterium]
MSFLAPLFLVGALAVALPILFHLIRRTSKDKTLFSSLMFLLPTPPRVTRKSRLENILLLILRCLVLCLLALGFARPFVQKAFQSNLQAGQGKRIAILVDSSASMRRANLWADARAKAEEVLKKTSPADQVALFTFDRQFNRLVSFEQWSAMGAGERVTLAAKRLADTSPGWASTHLGNALISTAEALQDLEGSDKQQPQLRSKQIVLISDLQEGSRLDALQGYEWPKETELIIEPLKPKKPTNAGLQLVTDLDESDKKAADARPRVRVSNSADAKREQFQVGWTRSGEKGFAGKAVDVYVPPGQSRVVMSPELPPGVAPDRLVLKGDDDDFDNTVYVVPLEAARTKILLLSNDSEKDTAQPPYFVRRAFQETRRQIVQVLTHKADGPLLPTDTEGVPLIIASDALPEEQVKTLRRLLNEGK